VLSVGPAGLQDVLAVLFVDFFGEFEVLEDLGEVWGVLGGERFEGFELEGVVLGGFGDDEDFGEVLDSWVAGWMLV